MFNVVLVEPEIPANTGNIGRTCVVTGSALHLVGPLGFSLDEKALHRAGLGYWSSLDLHVYRNWDDFTQKTGVLDTPERLHLLTKKAQKTYAEARYRNGDYLVFGKESTGLAEKLLASLPASCERIPMLPDADSITNAEDWKGPEADHSALLRQDICGNFIDPAAYRISALNLSNAAAIVLYEALRQTGFPGM